jgi:hypothetical protein
VPGAKAQRLEEGPQGASPFRDILISRNPDVRAIKNFLTSIKEIFAWEQPSSSKLRIEGIPACLRQRWHVN